MTSSEYWAKREAEALKSRITDEKEYDKQLKRIYSNMLDACQSEINAFYGKYAAKEGITLAEAKKKVSKLDIAAYERKAAKYVKEKDFSAKANEEMRLYNAAMKINRLEMLKANIGLELISGHDELEKYMDGILQGRTEDELKRQAGILGKTIKNNAQKANAIVNASFHNATFSDRIWMYQDLMKADLSKLLQSGLIQGKNPRVLARELKKTFQTSTFNAERLMRTELARVQTEAQKQSFERNGFEEYTFIVNGGCCEICQGLSGKHFKVAKMMPGENAPPIHPHCRCSTAAYSDRKEYEEWLDFLDKGGTTEEYNKMKAQKVNSVSTNKAAESGKIKAEEYKTFQTGDEANKALQRDVDKWESKITSEESESVRFYTGEFYADINQYYRKTSGYEYVDADLVKEESKAIDSVIKKFDLSKNIKVYRGCDLGALGVMDVSDLTVGNVYVDKGYMSTSVVKDVAKEFGDVLLEINVPKGKGTGAYINSRSRFMDEEYEFLIKRGAKCKIVEIDKSGDKPIVRMEIEK